MYMHLVHVHALYNWIEVLYMEYMYYWYWNVPECIKCKKLSVTFHHLYRVISLCMIFAIQNSKLSNVHWKDSIKLSQVHVCDCYDTIKMYNFLNTAITSSYTTLNQNLKNLYINASKHIHFNYCIYFNKVLRLP